MEPSEREQGPAGPRGPVTASRRRYAPPPQGRLAIGSCIARGAQVWARNLPAFVILSAILYLPLVAYTMHVFRSPPQEGASYEEVLAWAEGLRTWAFVFIAGILFLPLAVTGAVTYPTVQHLRGTPVGFVPAIGGGLARVVPALGVLLALLLLGVVGIFVLGLFATAMKIVGILLAAVLLAMVICALWVTIPAAIMEKPGFWGAFRRSLDLTRGNKAAIFVVVLVLGGGNWLITRLMETVFFSNPQGWEDLRSAVLAQIGVSCVLFGSLAASINAVGYHDLRTTRDGVTIEDIAKVFE